MTTHTPTPWAYSESDDLNHPYVITSGDPENNGYTVAMIQGFSCDDERDNAALIVHRVNGWDEQQTNH